jgi:trimeric autotransporter adhesin
MKIFCLLFLSSICVAASNNQIISVQSPLQLSSGLMSMPQGSGAQNGYIYSGDWTTFNNKQSAGNYITALTGDVTAAGPGSVSSTVAFVGGSSAASVHSAQLSVAAATSSNTPSTLVSRDGSGNFSAGTITASLTGAASLNVLKAGDTMTGTLVIEPGSGADINAIQVSSGTTLGTVRQYFLNNTPSTYTREFEFDAKFPSGSEILELQSDAAFITSWTRNAQMLSASGSAALPFYSFNGATGLGMADVAGALVLSTAGSAAITITSGVVNIPNLTASQAVVTDSSKNLVSLAYGSTNTASTLVERDSSGNFSAGTITASLTGAASLNVLKAGDMMTGTLVIEPGSGADITALQVSSGTTLGTVRQYFLNNTPATYTREFEFDAEFPSGSEILQLQSDAAFITSWTRNGQMLSRSGSAALPFYSFNGASGLGMSDVVGALVFSTSGSAALSLSTSGVVNIPNLTASQAVVTDSSKNLVSLAYGSANTASTLVERDGSGNFSAGTITASLTGTASGNLPLSGGTISGNLVVTGTVTPTGGIVGSVAGTTPTAGNVGEMISAHSSVGVTTNTSTNTVITSITLTTGVWMISGNCQNDNVVTQTGDNAYLYFENTNTNTEGFDYLLSRGVAGGASNLVFPPRVVVVASGDSNKTVAIQAKSQTAAGSDFASVFAIRIA